MRRKHVFFFLLPRTTVFVSRQHPVCPFGMADWLNRLRAFIIYTVFLIKKKKYKKSSVSTAASSVAFHGLPKADAGRGSNTGPGITKPVTPFHHSHRIAVNNLLRTFHRRLLHMWEFLRLNNFSYKLLINTPVCFVSAWSDISKRVVWKTETKTLYPVYMQLVAHFVSYKLLINTPLCFVSAWSDISPHFWHQKGSVKI